MTQMRPLWLLLIVTGAALAGYLGAVVMGSAGYSSPVLPISSVITLSAVGLVVLGLGLVVWWDQRRIQNAAEESRRSGHSGTSQPQKRHRRKPRSGRRLHPLQAARVVAAGQACAYAGALISGWHTGVLIDLAPLTGVGAPNMTAALAVVIGGLLWVIIGFVVETLCRIPPDQGESTVETRYDEDGTEPHAAF